MPRPLNEAGVLFQRFAEIKIYGKTAVKLVDDASHVSQYAANTPDRKKIVSRRLYSAFAQKFFKR